MESSKLIEKTSTKCFHGYQKVYSHYSEVLNCTMNFSVYLPPQAATEKCPLLLFLAGGNNDEQMVQNIGAQRFAAQYGFIIVGPDTEPRFKTNGTSKLSLYVNATQEPWNRHYKMYDYVTIELTNLIFDNFPARRDKQAIMGHSLGGHGALLIALQNPNRFKSASLIAPLCSLTRPTVTRDIMREFLGNDPEEWKKWDCIETVKTYKGPKLPILIDQGTEDELLDKLSVDLFVEECNKLLMPITINLRHGYDHGSRTYGFSMIMTFIENHFKHHAQYLEDYK